MAPGTGGCRGCIRAQTRDTLKHALRNETACIQARATSRASHLLHSRSLLHTAARREEQLEASAATSRCCRCSHTAAKASGSRLPTPHAGGPLRQGNGRAPRGGAWCLWRRSPRSVIASPYPPFSTVSASLTCSARAQELLMLSKTCGLDVLASGQMTGLNMQIHASHVSLAASQPSC
jgi:hypothetical protein